MYPLSNDCQLGIRLFIRPMHIESLLETHVNGPTSKPRHYLLYQRAKPMRMQSVEMRTWSHSNAINVGTITHPFGDGLKEIKRKIKRCMKCTVWLDPTRLQSI